MSKVLDVIDAHRYEPDRRRPIRTSLADVKVEEHIDSVPIREELFYVIGVQLSRSIWAMDSTDLEFKKSMVRRELAELIFGEFRPLLARLAGQVSYVVPYGKEKEEILEIIQDIERRMQ